MRFSILFASIFVLTACMGGSIGGPLGGSDVTAVVMQRSAQSGKLINAYRKRQGLSPVSEDPRLMQAAADHARDLASGARVSHYGSDGSDPAVRARRSGYVFANIGENVSAGRASLTEVIQAWIDSPPHRATLELDPATHFGLAHSFSPDSYYRHYWVLVLGVPSSPNATGSAQSGFNVSIGGGDSR